MTESIKSKMDKHFGIKSKNTLALAIEDEIKKIDVMRELRDLGKAYRAGHINDETAKRTIEMMLSCATREQLEGVYLKIIWNKQTRDERERGATGHSNRMGFNRIDAQFASSLMKQVDNGYSLTIKQISAAKKMLGKYWRQYLDEY